MASSDDEVVLQEFSADGDSDELTECDTDVNADFLESMLPFSAVSKGVTSLVQSLAFLICKKLGFLVISLGITPRPHFLVA